jgi:hypothetical protein
MEIRMVAKTLLLSLVALLGGCAAAQASFEVTSFGGAATDPVGNRVTQAGGHPDVRTRFTLGTKVVGGVERTDGSLRDAIVELPPGLAGDPTGSAVCENDDFLTDEVYCSPESQVGVLTFDQVDGPNIVLPPESHAIYRRPTPRGSVAKFAASIAKISIAFDVRVRVGDDGRYRVVVSSEDTPITYPIREIDVTFWGVPADPVHDPQRVVSGGYGQVGWSTASSSAPPAAFIVAPTSCPSVAQRTELTATPWEDPSAVQRASFDHDFDGFPMQSDGCGRLGFSPSATIAARTQAPDSPTGLDVEIRSPQNLSGPTGLASAQLRDVTVSLPEGLTVNPGSADGLQECSDRQLGLGSNAAAACPDASKLGSVTATTPVLPDRLEGDVVLRSQNSSDPESGEMFRLALVLKNDDRGILVKLPGALKVNKDTGRITATFKDNPQLPVENVKLAFKSGPRAPLVTPQSCGTSSFATQLTSWAGHSRGFSSPLDVACAPGLGGFSPSLRAGTARATAGASSSFALNATKPDGNAAVNGLRLDLPAGLLAKLKGNVGQQVGQVKAFAGPGSNPYVLPGKVYLEGRYDDAPFSLRVVVPAKAGPFDLGDVVVRQKVFVDPVTAQVSVVSDPLPTIVKGVPVRLQRLDVDIDKPDFVINPTSCAAKSIGGTLSAADGQTAPINVQFQVSDCASLDLKPSLALALSGKGQTTDGKHPAVSAAVSQPAGQANLKKVRVALPLSLALDPDNANGLCEFVDGSKATPTCPKASIVGTATAVTPILNEPLSGPVYFVKNVRKNPKTGRDIKTLPKLVIPLVGENGLKLTLTGTSDVEEEHLVTTFDNIPDAPVSSFKLNINGGKGGILAVSGADICKSTQIADQQMDGQNNKQADADVFIQTPSCPLKVLSKKVTAKAVTLKVGGLGAGKVTVTGKGIRKTSKSISKSTVATIVVRRTKGAPKQIKVTFLAKGAKKAKTAKA